MKQLRETLLALTLGAVILGGCGGEDDDGDAAQSTATAAPAGDTGALADVETFEVTSRDHVEDDLDYPQTPPVGGDHFPGWQNCGIYDEPVPDETAVHSLEHGAVWFTYDIDDPDAIASIEELAAGQTHVIVSPYPGQGSPVVATAWGVQLRLDDVDQETVAAFLVAYQQGPQTPEPGATCAGAIGEPR